MVKDHEIAAAVNALRDIAVSYHASGQLRERISALIVPLLRESQADVDRVNWLQRAGKVSLGVVDSPYDDDIDFYLDSDLVEIQHGETLREAIDHARFAEAAAAPQPLSWED